ncbi:metal ABC transporter solute-binding protein, Zn/Mn family [Paenirhodobacter sp.]|uniref:metal ABC transporter solute-binding protein, Zn/Mn family n=1 Tax=Paenirhodobacter sp. TaxID=1965326 RepID=UPI003B3EE3D2
MLTRRTLLASAAMALTLATGAQAAEPVKVVATFSIIGDLVHQVGGDHVAITTLVPVDGDAHVYQPTPADAKAVAAAQAVFVNGLEMEGWLDRLISASGTKAEVVTVTKGIEPLEFTREEEEEDHDHAGHHHHIEDPHAWQSVKNAEIYVKNIADALEKADPANAAAYKANAAAYEAKLKALDAHIREVVATIPQEHRTIVTSHDAFGYFGHEYGLEFKAPEGLSTESEASAADVAKLIDQIKAEKIPAIFMENITDPRLIEQIARETGTKIGGTVYSDALSPPMARRRPIST